MKFDITNIVPCALPDRTTCAGKESVIPGNCDDPAYRVTHPDCPDIPNCADPAFALAHPELCPNMPKLIIKPDVAVIGSIGELLYSTYLYADGRENLLADGVVYTVSDPTIAVIGTVTGSLTGIRPGNITVTATYGALTATAQLTVVLSCAVEPMAIAICIDASKSMSNQFSGSAGTRLDFAKALASSFIGCMNLSKDFAAVIEFDSSAVISQPITQNGSALLAQISAVEVGRASTNIGVVLNTASAHLKETVGTAATHVIFLLTDFENKEGENPILISRELKSGGAIVIVASLRSSGLYFRAALQSASGGFFANITPTNESDAQSILNGLKTHICSGACASTSSTIGPMGALNFNNFVQWVVSSGAVDYIGDGSGLFYDVVPGHGMYVDLVGSLSSTGRDGRGTLRQRNPIVYQDAVENTITFELAGNNREDRPNDTVTMALIDDDDNIFASQDYSIPSNQPFTPYTFTFTLGGGDPTSLRLQFTQTNTGAANQIANFVGCLLDNILITDETGTILFYENFENDNLVQLPASCSQTTIDTQYPYLAPFDCNAPGVQCVSSTTDCVPSTVYCITVSDAADPDQLNLNGVYKWTYDSGWYYKGANGIIAPNSTLEGQTEVPPTDVDSGWQLFPSAGISYSGCYVTDSTSIFGSWSLSGGVGCTATHAPTVVPTSCPDAETCPPPFVTAYTGNCSQGCGCIYGSPGSQIPDPVQLPELEVKLPDHVDRWTATMSYTADCRTFGVAVTGAQPDEISGIYTYTSATRFDGTGSATGFYLAFNGTNWEIRNTGSPGSVYATSPVLFGQYDTGNTVTQAIIIVEGAGTQAANGSYKYATSTTFKKVDDSSLSISTLFGASTIVQDATTLYSSTDLLTGWTVTDGESPAPTINNGEVTATETYTSEVSQSDANDQALVLATAAAEAAIVCSSFALPNDSLLYNFQFVDDPADWYPEIPTLDALTGVLSNYTPAEQPLVLAFGAGAISGGTSVANTDIWNPAGFMMVSSIQPQLAFDTKSNRSSVAIAGFTLNFSERLNFDNNGTRWKMFRVAHPNTLMRTYVQFYDDGGPATIDISLPVGGLANAGSRVISVAVIGHGILNTDIATWKLFIDGVDKGAKSTTSSAGWKAATLADGTHFVQWQYTHTIASDSVIKLRTTVGSGSLIQGFQVGFSPP